MSSGEVGSWESSSLTKSGCRRNGPEQVRKVRRATENGRKPLTGNVRPTRREKSSSKETKMMPEAEENFPKNPQRRQSIINIFKNVRDGIVSVKQEQKAMKKEHQRPRKELSDKRQKNRVSKNSEVGEISQTIKGKDKEIEKRIEKVRKPADQSGSPP